MFSLWWEKVASLEGRFQAQLSPTQRASLGQARKPVLFPSFLFQHILNHPRMQLGGKDLKTKELSVLGVVL